MKKAILATKVGMTQIFDEMDLSCEKRTPPPISKRSVKCQVRSLYAASVSAVV